MKKLQAFWSDRITDDEPSVFCVLSVESSHSLARAWSDLVLTRRRFGRRSWLASSSSSWLRTTELTWNRGMWHPHDNVLVLGTGEQLDVVHDTIATKWASAASKAGVDGSGRQYVERSDSTGDVRSYITKRMMGRGSRRTPGLTPGDLHLKMMQGDPDAFEAWQELEAFFGRGRVPGNLISRSSSLYDRQEVTHCEQVALCA